MKILIILNTLKPFGYNRRLHYDFLKKLENYSTGTAIVINKRKKKISIKEEYKKYQPDILIHYTLKFFGKNHSYHIPFEEIPCPQVLIVNDYGKIIGGSYEDKIDYINKHDLLIHRGMGKVDKEVKCPHVGLPLSANNEEITFGDFEKRENGIGFAGSFKRNWPRYKAIKTLRDNNLLVYNKKGKRIVGNDYLEFLKRYRGYLTSADGYTPFAKMFEIISSGGVVLTPSFFAENLMFEQEGCYVKYNEDCSDLVEKAQGIRNNPEQCNQITERAYNEFLKKHTHDKRSKELYDHLTNLLSGKDLIKIGGE